MTAEYIYHTCLHKLYKIYPHSCMRGYFSFSWPGWHHTLPSTSFVAATGFPSYNILRSSPSPQNKSDLDWRSAMRACHLNGAATRARVLYHLVLNEELKSGDELGIFSDLLMASHACVLWFRLLFHVLSSYDKRSLF